VVFRTNRNYLDIVARERWLPSFNEFLSIVLTFFLSVFGWIFFRSENLNQAFGFINIIFSKSVFSLPEGRAFINSNVSIYMMAVFVCVFIMTEWFGRRNQFALEKINHIPITVRWFGYIVIIGMIYLFNGIEQQFIYFQF
jgi:hypothetical protein